MTDKSVAERLLIRETYRVLLPNEPGGYRSRLGKLADGATIITAPSQPVDLAQIFVTSEQELMTRLPGVKPALKPNGLPWVTCPKGSSRLKADINRNTIREYARSIGLEAVAMISMGDTWSALRLKIV